MPRGALESVRRAAGCWDVHLCVWSAAALPIQRGVSPFDPPPSLSITFTLGLTHPGAGGFLCPFTWPARSRRGLGTAGDRRAHPRWREGEEEEQGHTKEREGLGPRRGGPSVLAGRSRRVCVGRRFEVRFCFLCGGAGERRWRAAEQEEELSQVPLPPGALIDALGHAWPPGARAPGLFVSSSLRSSVCAPCACVRVACAQPEAVRAGLAGACNVGGGDEACGADACIAWIGWVGAGKQGGELAGACCCAPLLRPAGARSPCEGVPWEAVLGRSVCRVCV